ncbi:multidrug transporter [Patiriisocius hiemis]|uniref:Multidrug transporter n=1 Tax=Patiriisocius hiemis TaxID=3075604 RepID=A0ABU2YBE1_9FLAO|nr:multidrug transporter [Constantimarinum sp. W242]MDT0555327.1 multidrug transporter [Constantimarinum sp. W242]
MMKTKFILFIGAIAFAFASCESDDTADIIIEDNSVTTINNNGGGDDGGDDVVILSGVYTSDLNLTADQDYLVNGPVIMSSGTTLNIAPGTTVRVAPVGVNAYIAITQGAKIIADANANNPIVFTSNASNPGSGDWGGLVLCGFAPINSTAVGSTDTSTTEIGSLSYGGNDPADDSGILRYVRVEYAGGAINGNTELNGVSIHGVGNTTVMDYVQLYFGSDDGFEFFGGTVNASHLSVVGSEDDSIDWTEGYTGNLTDIYIEQIAGAHDKAFECDGYNTDFSNEGGYFSAPNVTNVTIVGSGDTDDEAIRLRAGTQGIFTNVLISDFDEGFDLDGDMGDNPTGQGVLDDLLQAIDVTFNNVNTKVKNDTTFTFDEADFLSGDGNGTGTDYATWGAGWTRGL